MPNRSKRPNKKRGNRKRNPNRELPPNATKESLGSLKSFLKGPTRLQQDLHTTLVEFSSVLASDSSGVISASYTNQPTSYADWTNLTQIYDEYRVLGMVVDFVPFQFSSGSTTIIRAPYYTVIDYDTYVAPTSPAYMTQFSSCTLHNGGSRTSIPVLMSGVENGGFISTGSPTATFCVKIRSDGNTVSTNLYTVLIRAKVQFRGKGA